MINAIFSFEKRSYLRSYGYYLFMAALFIFGWFAGSNFNLSVGDGIHLNSPYNIGFISGMMSLGLIFIVTVFGLQVLFRESESRFDIILYSTPVSRRSFALGKMLAVTCLSFLSFLIFTLGFIPASAGRTGLYISNNFHLWYYLYPLLVFGLVNSLFISSVICVVAWGSRNKLLLSVTGLLLYIIYMVTLLFSNSPLMAQSLPQSAQAQQLAALLDPFGISAYFFSSSHYSVTQRNETIVKPEGIFALNRLSILLLSFVLYYLAYRLFSFREKKSRRNKLVANKPLPFAVKALPAYNPVSTKHNIKAYMRALRSFIRIDLLYIFKSIPIVIASMVLLFNTSMEMYAEIEKGIRLPQKFASSGLMASTILENFHLIGLLLACYYLNDIFWRSRSNRFQPIEDTSTYSVTKNASHLTSICVLILFFSLLLIAEGILFQFIYGYRSIDWQAYFGVIIFSSLPLMLSTALILLVNKLIKNRYAALAVSMLFILFTATPVINKIALSPLVKFQLAPKAVYSDFNGYGQYLHSYGLLLLFGACIIAAAFLAISIASRGKKLFYKLALGLALIVAAFFAAKKYMVGFHVMEKEAATTYMANYEKQYRRYQHLPQPVITRVRADISLYPSKNYYEINGEYCLKNCSSKPIKNILLNVNKEFEIQQLELYSSSEQVKMKSPVSELSLKNALLPGDSILLKYHISYQWYAANKHEPFNAIIGNGSFMRISRYFPQVGYQSQMEIEDEDSRKKYGVGNATALLSLDDAKTPANDLIELDMTVSTESDQTVIGTGELVKEWETNKRNFFRFKPSTAVPFRFAISSARYAKRSSSYKGKIINVYYHPTHGENVDHLLRNAQLTLDYCEANFGPYPFRSISFAEVSSFTKGFAATAYPAAIFMTEDMVFHANIKADAQQDVINELAGHELAHLWWGNSQVDPDDREGATMLTESLAMYTEMMLYKKMYGKEKMMERLKVHEQIYHSEKGFSTERPLYKVLPDQRHIAYSKGAMVLCRLSGLMGEDKLNKALRNFLEGTRNSHFHPITTDLLNYIYQQADKSIHPKIDTLFKTIEPMNAL